MAATPPPLPSATPLPTSIGIKSEVLLSAARPDLFRSNPFRITGLPVDASANQISRHVEKLRMAEKYGGGAGQRKAAFALDPPPDAEQLRGALQRLHDPEARLVDEFFWFWPHDQDNACDDALSALSQGNEGRAAEIWTQLEAQQSASNVSMHNLAVLAHLKVLDLDRAPRTEDLSTKELSGRTEMWRAAFRRWKVLMDDEAFWSRLTARIQRLDDPRLTTGTSRRMRESLPLALLSINAQLALRAAQAADVAEAKRQLAVMQESGFDANVASDALHRVIEPLRERIKTMCQAAQQDISADAVQGAAATRRLLEQSKSVLTAIDCLLPAGDPLRDGAHDEVALQSLSCQVVFGNKTEDWRTSVELLEQVFPIAVSPSARARIEENLRIVRENKKLGACFFCEEQPKDESAEIKVKLHGNVQTFSTGYNTTRTTWSHGTITVPRCKSCAEAHRQRSKSQGVGFGVTALSLAAYLLALTVISDLVSEGPSLLAYLAGVAATLIIPGMMAGAIGWLRSQGPVQGSSVTAKGRAEKDLLNLSNITPSVKPENSKFAFPAIQERKSAGWKLGEDPPGTVIPTPGAPHRPLLSKWGLIRRQVLAGRNVYIRVWVPMLLVLIATPPLIGLGSGTVGATAFLVQMGLASPSSLFMQLSGELESSKNLMGADGTNESAVAAFIAMRQLLHGSSGIDQPTVISALGKALENTDSRVRVGAAEELAALGSAALGASASLEIAARDQNADVAKAAAAALARVAPDRLVPSLIVQLGHRSLQVRQSAAQQLGNIGGDAKAAVPALITTTRDSDADVRRAATEALRKLVEPGIKKVTGQMKTSTSPAQENKAGRDQKVAEQLAKAQQLWRDGHPEEALQACDAALTLDPNNEEAASLRRNYAQAIAILNGGKQ